MIFVIQSTQWKRTAAASAALLSLTLVACGGGNDTPATGATATPAITIADVVTNDAKLASAVYSDSVIAAQTMKSAIEALVADPSEATLNAARQSWLDAREPYGQSEVYRFRLSPIDSSDGVAEDGPEGSINAWPLGEAIIDYVATNVDGDSGPEATAPTVAPNIIADDTNVPTIDKTVIASLNEQGGDERNVASGYHAVEFLLWGQDLNTGTTTFDGSERRDSSAGQRPFSDYLTTVGACTSGAGNTVAESICTRRGQYIVAATELLIDELQGVASQWEASTGAFYISYTANPDRSLAKMVESMGRLGFGELAGERINIALTQDSQEDEHSCFSDNTHRDIVLNAQGIQNSFLGTYTRIDGSIVTGPSLKDYLTEQNQVVLSNELTNKLATTMTSAAVIDNKAKSGTPFDRQIQQGGINDPDIKAVIAALVSQTQTIESVIQTLNLSTGDIRQDTEESL